MKKSFIVRRYTSYEFIHTEEAYCKLQVLLKYYRQGWKIWDYPVWFVIFMKKRFGITLNWGNQNLFVEKLIPGSDQITHYYPY